jgi:predicted DNA binding CopG/RHH family protein
VLQAGLQAAVAPAPAPVAAPTPAPQPVAIDKEPRSKSLTLRLSETQYERLRRFAFERRLSHQDIIERALLEHLDREGRT